MSSSTSSSLNDKYPWTKGVYLSSPGHSFKDDHDVLLFKPYKIKDIVLKNRIVIPPMCQYSAIDGFMNEYHIAHLGSFALGGAGLIIVEATGVTPNGRISPFDLGIWNDDHITEMKKVIDLCHSFGTAIGIQIAHAGRKACTSPIWLYGDYRSLKDEYPDWDIVGPSPIAFDDKLPVPRELSKEDINNIQQSFVDAAIRADKAGFDVLEIHGAHGYLISSFLSPNANKRNDEYGGSFENRIRFLIEIVDKVRNVWPQRKPFFVRLSCSEYVENGWSIDDTVELSKILKEHGVDMIDCSSGSISSNQVLPELVEGYQVPFSDAVKNKANIPTLAVGLIYTPSYAESVLKEGKADLIEIGRGVLKNSIWPFYAAESLGVQIIKPIQYRLDNNLNIRKDQYHNK